MDQNESKEAEFKKYIELTTLKYQDLWEKRYGEQSEHQELFNSIKVNRNIIASNCKDAFIGLVNQTNSIHEYNAVSVSRYEELSSKGRLKIARHSDMFNSISISCWDFKDIESVTFYMGILVPIDLSKADFSRGEKVFDYIDPFDGVTNKTHFLPIKTITNFESNTVSFFKYPILLEVEGFYHCLSIEVKMKNCNLRDKVMVKTEGFILDSKVRSETKKIETIWI